MNKRPNILFIRTDHQRFDSIGMEQCGIEVMPNLNKLSAQGVTFNKAYTTCPLCVPARTAIATGKYPTNNSVVYNDWEGRLSGDHKSIHQYLYEQSYDVAHIGIDHIKISPPLKERIPFVEWTDDKDYGKFMAEQGISIRRSEAEVSLVYEKGESGNLLEKKYSNIRTSIWPHNIKYFRDSYFCQKSINFLKRERYNTFGLFVYFSAPHPPLRVPEPYASKFDPKEIKLPANVGIVASGEPAERRRGVPAQLAENVSMDEWRKVWAAHLGLLNYIDDQIGYILKTIEEIGEADNTIIVFTSDHGDSLGQHKMYQKMEMYDQAIRVPMIIKIPQNKPCRINSPVSHIDILPTLLDLVETEYGNEFDGTSLSKAIKDGIENYDRKVFCQYSGNPELGSIRRSLITSKYKYIYDGTDSELYDLEKDPMEMQNVYGDEEYNLLAMELHKECKIWAANHGDWVNFK